MQFEFIHELTGREEDTFKHGSSLEQVSICFSKLHKIPSKFQARKKNKKKKTANCFKLNKILMAITPYQKNQTEKKIVGP